jgi:hydroxymethylpyrimidine pyrophosphatase-like HAD family hydrolase
VYQCSVFFNNQIDKMQDVNFDHYGLKLVHWHHIGADILPVDASKARGIKDVCEYYAVDVNECMAFGDGMNDLEMFDLVGYAVAMGDAQPDLIARADFVTGTIEERGIQAVLEQFHVTP